MTAEEFRERCRQAGIGDDKPLSQVLLTVFVAAETALATIQTSARGITQEGEAELVNRVVKTVDASVKVAQHKHRLRLERRASIVAGGVVAAGLLLTGGCAYWLGWSNGVQASRVIEHEVAAAAIAAGPEAAADWVKLMRGNDLTQALAWCSGAAVWVTDGRHACAVPLWIDGPSQPPTKR
jgi:hypothetical protein